MEITSTRTAEGTELHLSGRLDAYWSDHLTHALSDALHAGADRITLHMGEVVFISSAGIRVLLTFYKQLQRMHGALLVSNPSDAVKKVLDLAGLQSLLSAPAAAASAAALVPQARRFETAAAVFDVYELSADSTATVRIIGTPGAAAPGVEATASCGLAFPPGVVGVGLGAFGSDFADCRGRFGEFLAAGGAAAYLPGDGTNVPDYLLARGAYVPELQVLYGISCEGAFARLARFESTKEDRRIRLSEIAAATLEMLAQDTAVMVIAAESAGLVGASVRRAVTETADAADPFDYPAVRDWLSFTGERVHRRSLALAVGIVARAPQPDLALMLRPLDAAGTLFGHCHAAAFSYRPLPNGLLDLRTTITALFEGETLQAVLHLLHDDRDMVGIGESEFVRGACWMAPLRRS